VRSLAIRKSVLGADHPDVGISLNNLADVYFVQADWVKAVSYWRRSTDLAIKRSKRGADIVGATLTGKSKREAEGKLYQFWFLVKAAHRLAVGNEVQRSQLGSDMFKVAQWMPGSETASSLVHMATRQVKGDTTLA
jgi:hypothetical protein